MDSPGEPPIRLSGVGVYSEYLDRQMGFNELADERRALLRRIVELRGGRDVLVFAADLNVPNLVTNINYSDLLPINDQLANLRGSALDLILETPGGSGEVAEDIVRLLRNKYEDLAVIVPGWAKSAGTIMAMAADEILMEPASALGPIDAQIFWQGKVYSADALLEQWKKIRNEVQESGNLNKAYIPMLQMMSLGELQSADNQMAFARRLVTAWLATYKFRRWEVHSSTGQPVTEAERTARAEEIAAKLSNHAHWLVHGRSIKIADLEAMQLRITDYSQQPDLADAIRRYHTLMQMTFETNAYKLFETTVTHIIRFMNQVVPPPPSPTLPQGADELVIDLVCNRCQRLTKLQVDLDRQRPLKPGLTRFPANNRLICPQCRIEHDLSDTRRQIEGQTGKRIAT